MLNTELTPAMAELLQECWSQVDRLLAIPIPTPAEARADRPHWQAVLQELTHGLKWSPLSWTRARTPAARNRALRALLALEAAGLVVLHRSGRTVTHVLPTEAGLAAQTPPGVPDDDH